MNLTDRSQYLSLALFLQSVISALIDYADENKTEKLKPCLEEALDSLLQMKRSPTAPRRRTAAFRSYEQLRTLQEVWNSKQRSEVVSMIREILRAPQNPKSKRIANKVIDLFQELQTHALWNFEQRTPVSPKVLTRLCRMA